MKPETLKRGNQLTEQIEEMKQHLRDVRRCRAEEGNRSRATGAEIAVHWSNSSSRVNLYDKLLPMPGKKILDLYEQECEQSIAALEKEFADLRDAMFVPGASGASDDTVRQHAL